MAGITDVPFRALAWLSGVLGAMRAPFLAASYRLLFFIRAVLLKSPSSGFLEGPTLALGDVVEAGQVLATVGEKMARQRVVAAELIDNRKVAYDVRKAQSDCEYG